MKKFNFFATKDSGKGTKWKPKDGRRTTPLRPSQIPEPDSNCTHLSVEIVQKKKIQEVIIPEFIVLYGGNLIVYLS